MPRTNDVTLFSNGIGHFRRVYQVPGEGEEAISIPFKTDYIGDVAASLQVFGKVRLTAPPSFTPANSNATSLKIDQANSLTSLLKQLSGAQVEVSPSGANEGFAGTLVGTETIQGERHGVTEDRPFIVVLTETGVRKVAFEYMGNVSFIEDSVRTEIEKALRANFQKIKPDSTILDLKLSALEGETDSVVQYTIPVAAWKMRYAIRQEKGNFSLEGAAIIDNNTDEDWDNFQVSVVTGEPISFNTDIAEVVVPQRRMVRLVDGLSLSNVDVEEGMVMECAMAAAGGPPAPRAALRARGGMGAKMSLSNRADFGMESMAECAYADDDMEAAAAPGVESKEVGDFCIFTSKEPITILARKSAVVPMFTVDLKHAGVVLLYKEANHAKRPYRAVKFKNETEYSLGKGKTVIYNEGVFSGECVLQTAKPNEQRMLPHCLENGVKVSKESKGYESTCSKIIISDGVAIHEDVQTTATEYTISNKKDEAFKFALEHTSQLGVASNVVVGFEGVEIKEQEKLSDGWRLYFELPANETLTLTATETRLNRQDITLGSNFHWLQSNIIARELPIAEDPQIQACIAVQTQLDEAGAKIHTAQERLRELSEQAERVRQNIGVTSNSPGHDTVTAWIKDLDDTEQEIRKIQKETLPSLERERRALQKKLQEELKKITASWEKK
jgi:hypothetical protein